MMAGIAERSVKFTNIPIFLLLYLLTMDSPYINEVDVVPPSPQLDSYQDFPAFNDPSYYSPFSNHSELSFIGEHDLDLTVFDDPAHTLLTDYDPADYDNPTASSLLVYQDNDYMPPYNYASPSSDNDDDKPSRASSVSYSASPRFDVAQSFEAMSFRSPAFPTESLPHSPQPLSPPRLFMPDDHLPDPQPLPKINAPDPDNGLGGLMLNIVPATPIGGGASAANPVPFLHASQQSPFQLAQNQPDSSLGLQLQQPWSTVNHPSSTQSSNTLPKQEYTFPSQGSLFDDYPSSAPLNSRSVDDAAATASNSLLIPTRTRSKSDTSPEQLPWAQPYLSSNGVSDQTVNDIPSQQPQLNPNFTFGSKPANDFLSPNNPPSIRRVKSETVSKPIHRQSRSEDIRGIGLSPSHPGHHHSQSSNQYLSPPGQRGYLSPNLSTFGLPSLPSGGRSASPVRPSDASPGHVRRASSGTRSERGSEAWPGASPLAQHRVSPYPSPHASPRLRLNDLPYDDYAIRASLLDVGFPQSQAGYHNGYPGTYTPSSTGGSTYHTPGQSPSPTPQLTLESSVPRPTVTTGRTADASQKRRKQDATFSCPIPGCGSTFTRSFNLKGDRCLFSFIS